MLGDGGLSLRFLLRGMGLNPDGMVSVMLSTSFNQLLVLLLCRLWRLLLLIVDGLPVVFGGLLLTLRARRRLIHLLAILVFVVYGILAR